MKTIAINQSNKGSGGAPSAAEFSNLSPPDPEVTGKRPHRKFTAKYKLKMLKKADTCTEQGQLGALLRQEGLYSSNLTTWRRQRDEGLKENQQLKQKLKQAELIIDAQKKISEILGVAQNPDENERSSS